MQFDNKGGAAGTIGLAQFVNSAKGDPNALMVGGMVMVGGILLNKSPVDLSMVTPIARLTSEYVVIVVPANSPHKTMGDLVKAFKADPGKVSWGGGSAGGTDHILAGLIAKAAGGDPSKVNYVPQGRRRGDLSDRRRPRHRRCRRASASLPSTSSPAACARLRCRRPPRSKVFPSLKEQGIDVVLGNWRGVFGAPAISTAQRDAWSPP